MKTIVTNYINRSTTETDKARAKTYGEEAVKKEFLEAGFSQFRAHVAAGNLTFNANETISERNERLGKVQARLRAWSPARTI